MAISYDVVFFDFDGTLVQSAGAKYEVFFAIFPATAGHRATVAQVLERDPDGSRYAVIPRMIEGIRARGLDLPPGHSAEDRIAAYAAAAFELVARSPEMPGASRLLQALGGRVHRVIMSVTPQAALDELIRRRGWQGLVEEAYGYPAAKPEIIARVLRRLGKAPGSAAVVGDGVSDADAALLNGCPFFGISGPQDLESVADELGVELVR